MTEAEIGEMQAKEHEGVPATPENKRKAQNRLSPRDLRGNVALQTP